jgi:hypothetical protein
MMSSSPKKISVIEHLLFLLIFSVGGAAGAVLLALYALRGDDAE